MMSDNHLREDYLNWLDLQLGMGTPDTYWGLTNLMFDQEFACVIQMDHNRVNDGLDLRNEYFHSQRVWQSIIPEPCSFLEVLLGLSRRMAFVAGGSKESWARQLILNLEFDKARDPLIRSRQNKIVTTMARVISRTYDENGVGGFFPLAWPDRDQRDVELWYQLNSYVEERHPGI